MKKRLSRRLPHSAKFKARRVAFAGPGPVCEFCGARVRRFAAHGGGPVVNDVRQVVGGMRRENDRCPVCHSRDRTRLLRFYLERELSLAEQKHSVLHFAPDFGLYLWLKTLDTVVYTGTDIDTSRYRHIEPMVTSDIVGLPFADDSYDVIICSHVLEHIPDDAAALSELRRVLKPGGVALLLTPLAIDGAGTDEDASVVTSEQRERRFGQWDHVRMYGMDNFLERVDSAGFEAEFYNPFSVDADAARAALLNPLERIAVGRKPA